MAEVPQLRDALKAIFTLEAELARIKQREREPIAIVGISSRTPFESKGVGFWEGLIRGIDTSAELPESRWGGSQSEAGAAPDKTVRRGNFLTDISEFDAGFFSIARAEALPMDPQQRMLLELTWEAFADAGFSSAYLRRIQTGVFVGSVSNEYSELAYSSDLPPGISTYLATGNYSSALAGRISYVMGLTGPALVVDTACSSSLVAVHLACDSLRLRTSEVAIAGGVNLIASPRSTTRFASMGGVSVDGRCRTFDASGAGFGRGEGCGIVVLKRLSDALRDGDRIYALVRGSALNQDGPSDGLTAPSGPAQQRVVKSALEFAKLTPADVQYVEAHGTGTVLGDPIEVEALGEVFGAAPRTAPLAIGSIKSNLGHLEGASGITGLLKLVHSIRHRQLPASVNFRTPNPHIPWEALPVRVQTELTPWPMPNKPLIAGVSAFGFSGTNAHAIVSEPPAVEADKWKDADRLAQEAKLLPLCVSAKTPEALLAYAKRFSEWLSAPLEDGATWRDAAYTANVRQTHLEHRLVVLGSSPAEWADRLQSYSEGKRRRGVLSGEAGVDRSRVVFVFSGHGSQWLGMGRSLLESSAVFREQIDRCEQALRPFVNWSLREQLLADASSSRLTEIDVIQPVLFAFQVALAAVWASQGVVPDAVIGHSMGEVAAAFVAGALTLEDAARVICVRSKLLTRIRGRGAMVSVDLTIEEAEAELEAYHGKLSVASSNGPRLTVVSGDAEAAAALTEALTKRDIVCRPAVADGAGHSSQADELKDELLAELQTIRPNAPTVRFVSTALVDAKTKPSFDAAYWWTNMREPVRLSTRVAELLNGGHELFLEISPQPLLAVGLTNSIEASGKPAVVIASLRRQKPEAEMILEALGELHIAGYPVNWEKFFGPRGRVLSVPSYPWQRQRFWVSSASSRRHGGHEWSLMHTRLAASDQAGKHIFEAELDLKDRDYAYIADHSLRDGTLLPGAAFLEMALEAGTACAEGRAVRVSEVTLSQALVLSEKEPVVVQLVLSPEQDGAHAFRISSRPTKDTTLAWTTHASGRLAFDRVDGQSGRQSLGEAQRRCTKAVDASEVYDNFAGMGMAYGPAFRGIEQAWVVDGQALSKLAPVEKLTEAAGKYLVHPCTLDAAFQTMFVAAQGADSTRSYLLASVGSIQVFAKSEARWAHAQLRSANSESVECDVVLFDEEGVVVAEVKALRATVLGRAGDKLDGWLFDQVWRANPAKTAEAVDGRWLVLADERGTAPALEKWLQARGADVVTVARGASFAKQSSSHFVVNPLEPDSLRRALTEAFGKSAPKRIVHCFGLDTRQNAEAPLDELAVRRAEELTCTSIMVLAQVLAELGWSEPPRLFLVTRGCQPATGSRDVKYPEQALAWGFGFSLMHEMAELKTTLIDLDDTTDAAALGCELAGADDESRVALRGKERWVPRLARHVRPKKAAGAIRPLTVGAEEGYELRALDPEHLESPELVPTKAPAPGPGQVVIRTAASALDGTDSLECAGVVFAVGAGVTSVRVGDAVVATAKHAFDAYVVTPAELVVAKPASLSFEQAASLPCAAMTVLYALDRVGRLRKGERILIHAAAGGIGLAAVQYAKHVGAEIYATAESDEKQAHLRKLGLEHVYDSRTSSWVDGVMRDTSGRGVNVVLNSLAGEALPKGLSVLAPYGRFLQLGRGDAFENNSLLLSALRSNITVSAVALDPFLIEGPPEVRARTLLEDAFRLVESGALSALPVESFPVSRARDAFERLSRPQHVGQVVLTSEEHVSVRDPNRMELVVPDKTYLITGGLGGLGLVMAKRIVKLGAKHVALMGRSAPSDAAQRAIGELEASGARVYTVRADVADRQSLSTALAELARTAPPVAGVIHSAGVLDDAMVSNLTAARIGPVLAPKVLGAVALDTLLPDLTLRVYFGSVAGVLGVAGQTHYAGANTFLDSYAHYHSAHSRHAVSLDWGLWGDVGGATAAVVRENLTRQGLAMISSEDGAEQFERALSDTAPQLVAAAVDFRQWRQANPQVAGMPFLREVVASMPAAEKNVGLFDRLKAAMTNASRLLMIEEYLRVTVAGILHSTPEAVSRTAPFKQLGFDSLMTVGFKNALERDLGIPISTAALFKHHSVERLATFIVSKLEPTPPEPRQEPPRVDVVVETAEPAPVADASDPNNAALPSLDSMLSELTKGGYL